MSEARSQKDLRLKERIINGEVEYSESPWLQLPDGLILLFLSMALSLSLSHTARTLVEALLVHNSTLRATISDALQSTWIFSEADDLEALYRHRVGELAIFSRTPHNIDNI